MTDRTADVAELAQRVYAARRDRSLADESTKRWEQVLQAGARGFRGRSGRDLPGFSVGEKAAAKPLRRALRLMKEGQEPTEAGRRAAAEKRRRRHDASADERAVLEKQRAAALASGERVKVDDAFAAVVEAALQAGGKVEHRSLSGSVYLARADGARLRIADHRVPESALRAYGASWAKPETVGEQILVRGRRADADDLARGVVERLKAQAVAWVAARQPRHAE